MTSIDSRYPIGKAVYKPRLTAEERATLIHQIGEVPERLAKAIAGFSEEQLNTPYREGGWTVRQVVHHIADSHANAFTRFRLALTEDNPTIKPYDQSKWSELYDSRTAPVDVSMAIIEGLHTRWVMMLESMKPTDFERPLVHPESGPQDVDRLLQTYAWHGRHHVAHIVELRKGKNW